jgi:prepilin-type N-terminal cleavage/methylation domain-containing protein
MCKKTKSQIYSGFTLVELLVVIFIIGLLVAILLPALSSVAESGRRKTCTVEIQQMQTALSLYEENYRDFPPSTLAEIGLSANNQINNGVETLVACLSGTYKDRSYFTFREKQLDNTDKDTASIPLKKLTGSIFNNNELWELMDPWANPYIYFHHRDILETTRHFYILLGEKKTVGTAMTRNKTGILHGTGQYQIISCGTDGTSHTQDDEVPNEWK